MAHTIPTTSLCLAFVTLISVGCARQQDDAAETIQRDDIVVAADTTSPTKMVQEPAPPVATPHSAAHTQHATESATPAKARAASTTAAAHTHGAVAAAAAAHEAQTAQAVSHAAHATPSAHAAPSMQAHPHGDELSAVARAQIEQVRTATAPFRDIEAARAAGYVMFGKAEGPLMGEHWYLKGAVREAFDLARPSTLQYVNVGGEKKLVGVAYTVYQRPGEPLPEGFDGSADHWHVHDVAKLARAFVAERPFLRWVVERRASKGKIGAGDGRTLLVMLHAWVWTDNPDGVFALHNRALPYQRAGLPGSWVETASEDAAWGLALTEASGCTKEIARTNALAKLSREQKSRLSAACEEAASAVRVPLERKDGPTQLNMTAAGAWLEYSAVRDRILKPEQKERMAAVIEHDPSSMGQHH